MSTPIRLNNVHDSYFYSRRSRSSSMAAVHPPLHWKARVLDVVDRRHRMSQSGVLRWSSIQWKNRTKRGQRRYRCSRRCIRDKDLQEWVRCVRLQVRNCRFTFFMQRLICFTRLSVEGLVLFKRDMHWFNPENYSVNNTHYLIKDPYREGNSRWSLCISSILVLFLRLSCIMHAGDLVVSRSLCNGCK